LSAACSPLVAVVVEDVAIKLKNAMTDTATWIYIMHYRRFKKAPFNALGQCVDRRLSWAVRECAAKRVCSAPLCCLDEHLLRKFRENGIFTSAADIMKPKMQGCIFVFSM
jgi:hypothetical protein